MIMINENYKTVMDFVCLGDGCISVWSTCVVWGMDMCVPS